MAGNIHNQQNDNTYPMQGQTTTPICTKHGSVHNNVVTTSNQLLQRICA